jgi:hypothetical protein
MERLVNTNGVSGGYNQVAGEDWGRIFRGEKMERLNALLIDPNHAKIHLGCKAPDWAISGERMTFKRRHANKALFAMP